MDEILIPLIVIPTIFIGLPWLFLHYMTQWKRARGLSVEDEKLLDELYETARKLDDRLTSIERITAADHPEFRSTRFGETPLNSERRH